MRIPDGFGGELPEAVSTAQEAVIDMLDMMRAQIAELDSAQIRNKTYFDR